MKFSRRQKRRKLAITDLPKDQRFLEITVVLFDKARSRDVGRAGKIIYEQTFKLPDVVYGND